jgi:hypothetical protein
MKLHVGVLTHKFMVGSIIAILAFCAVSTAVHPAAGAATGWSKTYGGSGSDSATYFVKTNDGGYAISGYTNSFGAGGRDAWLIKTDSAGNMQWNKTYGGTGDDYAYSLVQTVDGGYSLFGMTFPGGLLTGIGDYWLVKTDSAGNMQWNKTYGAPTTGEYGFHGIQTIDGGYVMSGWNGTASGGPQISVVWLVKADAVGNMQWNRTFARAPGYGNEVGFTVIQAKDGGYAIAACTNSSGTGLEGWLIKTDSSGNLQWDKTYGGTPYGLWYSLVQTVEGGYAAVGTTDSYGAGGRDVWLGKMDSAGNMQWNKTYGGKGDDYGTSIAQAIDGGFVIGGYTPSFGAGGTDVWVIKTDLIGNAQWNKTFGGPGNDGGNGPHAIAQAADGGYAVVNYGASFGAGGNDAYLIKFDAAGNTPAPPAASAFTNVNVLAGCTWYFFAQSTGDVTPFTYQWYENNTLLQGQTSMVLPVTKTVVGTYTFYCKVTDAQGMTVTSNNVTLTVMG